MSHFEISIGEALSKLSAPAGASQVKGYLRIIELVSKPESEAN
jgi:hypothetical protein